MDLDATTWRDAVRREELNMGEAFDLEEYRRKRWERRMDASGNSPEEECDILDKVFGLHTETRDSPCAVHNQPTATCRGRWNQRQ